MADLIHTIFTDFKTLSTVRLTVFRFQVLILFFKD
jgi:hypothetical protein